MFIVIGATGHIGSVVVKELLSSREQVMAVLHNPARSEEYQKMGAKVEVADVHDVTTLNTIFSKGHRAFLLNPPAAPSTNTNLVELGTAKAIAKALRDTNLEKVVVASTYGAQPGDGIGDLSTLFEFEQLVSDLGIPTAINRGAYYFTNLDMLIEPAKSGILPTMFPADFKLPMVAPSDLGRAAARRLRSPPGDIGIHYVEGPARYSFSEVAMTLSELLGTDVKIATTPRHGWEESFMAVGFSPEAAKAYAKMTEATISNPDLPSQPQRGVITLKDYLSSVT